MKTVKDYLDLGLVFVDDDKLLSSTKNEDSKEVCMSGLCIAHKRYCEGFRGGSAIFFYPSEWTPSSFAWRNNDGVKPDYKGLIEVEMKSGAVMRNKEAGNLMWSLMLGGHYIIAKWRPVVLQSKSEDLKNKLASEISSSMGASGLTPKGIINVLSEVFKPKPPFWNKSMQIFSCPCVAVNVDEPVKKFTIKEETPKTIMTVNIEGRDYLIASHNPTVSQKEDKPMKPVYTAEMHAKNELPHVDSEVKVCIKSAGFDVDDQDVKFEGKIVTVRAAFNNAESEKIVAVENEDGNCACYIIECIKPIIKTIKVNGFDVPEPISEAPEHRKMVYLAHAAHVDFNLDFTWQGDDASVSWLSRGLVHSTKLAAIAHAKAMLGINPNA